MNATQTTYETRLRRIMVEEGRKPTWLAAECDVTPASVTGWMNGSRTPTKQNMQSAARALRRTEQDVFFTPIDHPLFSPECLSTPRHATPEAQPA